MAAVPNPAGRIIVHGTLASKEVTGMRQVQHRQPSAIPVNLLLHLTCSTVRSDRPECKGPPDPPIDPELKDIVVWRADDLHEKRRRIS